MTPRTRAIVLACAGYTAAAIAYTWPLAAKLDGVVHDAGDPLLTTWFLWWSGSQAVPLTSAWWNAPTFYPATGVLAFSEHLLGLTPIAAPIALLTGNQLIGHNVAFIATFVLGALGAHFLAYALTRRHDVSAIAAIAFAFAPYRLSQVSHLQILASFWTPVCLGALHRYAQTWRFRWIVLASGAWVMQGLCCGYFFLFLALLVGLWFLWFGFGRWPARRIGTAAAAFAAGGLVLVPFLLGYQTILRDTYGFHRSIGEIRIFSADLASLLSASEELLAWGWLNVIARPESQLFPGLTMVLLAGLALYVGRPFTATTPEPRWMGALRWSLTALVAIALVASALPFVYGPWQLTLGGVRLVSIARGDKPFTVALGMALVLVTLLPGVRAAFRRRSAGAFYFAAAFVTWLCALGPDPTVMQQRLLYRSPYGVLMMLPGFDGLRVPARFWTMTLACLAVVGALAVHRLSGSTRRVVVALAMAGLLIDGWPRRFPVLDAPAVRPSPREAVVRLDLPTADDTDPFALYQQMFDAKPLYNGFSGYAAPHYRAMRELIDEHDPRILHALASRGPLGVVVDHAGDQDGALRAMVRAFPGSRTVQVEADWSSYLIPRTEAIAPADVPRGSDIRVGAVSASAGAVRAAAAIDGDLDTVWNGGEQRSDVTFTITLEAPTHVGGVVTEMGPASAAYPVQLQIDVSADGSQWQTAWTGSTALMTYYAAVQRPKDAAVFYPIGRDGVRFIRLQQTGRSEREWFIAELRVVR